MNYTFEDGDQVRSIKVGDENPARAASYKAALDLTAVRADQEPERDLTFNIRSVGKQDFKIKKVR